MDVRDDVLSLINGLLKARFLLRRGRYGGIRFDSIRSASPLIFSSKMTAIQGDYEAPRISDALGRTFFVSLAQKRNRFFFLFFLFFFFSYFLAAAPTSSFFYLHGPSVAKRRLIAIVIGATSSLRFLSFVVTEFFSWIVYFLFLIFFDFFGFFSLPSFTEVVTGRRLHHQFHLIFFFIEKKKKSAFFFVRCCVESDLFLSN